MLGSRDFSLDSVRSRGDRVVVAFSWADPEGRRHPWAQSLRLKGDKIIEMQDFKSAKPAIALMRLRTVFG
jgi:TolB-like protein